VFFVASESSAGPTKRFSDFWTIGLGSGMGIGMGMGMGTGTATVIQPFGAAAPELAGITVC